jgi:hypothetical protein
LVKQAEGHADAAGDGGGGTVGGLWLGLIQDCGGQPGVTVSDCPGRYPAGPDRRRLIGRTARPAPVSRVHRQSRRASRLNRSQPAATRELKAREREAIPAPSIRPRILVARRLQCIT